MYGCAPNSVTDEMSQLSHCVLDEFKRQLNVFGYVKDCDHRELLKKLPKMDTREHVTMPLHWVIEGHILTPEQKRIKELEQ